MSLEKLIEINVDLIKVSASKRANLQVEIIRPVWVSGDPGQLRQVLINLVTNASDAFENDTGTICIKVDEVNCNVDRLNEFIGSELAPGTYASLKVTDTGVGMSATVVERVFDPFYTTKFTGRGLGMAVVRTHGGSIRIASVEGKGTLIEILLPLTPKPESKLVPDSRRQRVHVEGKTLIVDDEDSVRTILSAMLNRLKIAHEAVCDGREAIAILSTKRKEFGVVVLDVTMPEIDGITVAYQLLLEYPDLPIILSSGFTGKIVPDDLLSRIVFLRKPFTLIELSDAIASAINPVAGTKPAETEFD